MRLYQLEIIIMQIIIIIQIKNIKYNKMSNSSNNNRNIAHLNFKINLRHNYKINIKWKNKNNQIFRNYLIIKIKLKMSKINKSKMIKKLKQIKWKYIK